MTVRDPYTGTEQLARKRPPQSPLQRWWPAGAIALVAVVVGYVEWHNAQTPVARPAAATAQPHVASTATIAAPTVAASPSASAQATNANEIAQAAAALAKASDQLSGTSNLLIGIAALQALVLVGQLYLFGRQRRAGQDEAE